MTPVHMNSIVRVKLTNYGREVHRLSHELRWLALGNYPYSPPKEDENGWSEWAMWELMKAFGPHVSPTKPSPFESLFEIKADKLRQTQGTTQ